MCDNTGGIKTMTEETKLILQKIDEINQKLEEKTAGIDQKLEEKMASFNQKLEEKTAGIDQKLEEKTAGIDQKLEEKMASFNQKLGEKTAGINQKLEEKTASINQKLDKLNQKVTSIEMTVENELTERISIVAEGHVDLYRKLDEALKVENEKEMLSMRVNILEHEVRRVAEKIENIA